MQIIQLITKQKINAKEFLPGKVYHSI